MAAAHSTEPAPLTAPTGTTARAPLGTSVKGVNSAPPSLSVPPDTPPEDVGDMTSGVNSPTVLDPLVTSAAIIPMPAETPITYSEVVRAVQDAMAPMMEAQSENLKRVMQDMKTQLHQLSQQVVNNEHKIGETFQDVHNLKEQYDALKKSHLQLSNKVDDLENRSRRCNLRIVGIPETVKGQDLFKFLQTELPSILQVQSVCSDMVIERAHRLGPTRQLMENRPRVVIFKTLSFLHKEALWQASRKQKEIRWKDARLFVFQDYSSEVSRARKEFSALCSRLVKDNKKFALLFPARLRLYDGTSFKEFSSVADAEGYLAELSRAAEDLSSPSSPQSVKH